MKIVKASLIAAIALVGSSAFAQTPINASFAVSTEVLKFCKISANPIAIAPITAGLDEGAKSNSGAVNVYCTNQTNYNLAVTESLNLKHEGTETFIATSLVLDNTSGKGAGFSADRMQSHKVTATIAETAYQNALAGKYNATTTVTLTY